ncbi:MAG: type I DNA topoisomerase [Rickettsiales bacterium]|nr:type I DNA topoisomerase [Rickettsiales bacterium]
MDLIIVESPTKARTIGKYLGKGYNILSSYGHIRGIPSRDKAVLPEKNFSIEYEINTGAVKNVKKIIDAVKKANHIYIAADPDREGESIAWHIVEVLKEKVAIKKDIPVKRIIFHEITKQAITEALEHPRNIDKHLVDAQQARRALDYLVGFTLSPILWRKLPGSRSAGRVQSVALRLICDRENEIEKFVTQEYWTIDGNFKNSNKEDFISRLISLDGKKLEKFSIPDKKEADKIVKNLLKHKYFVKSVEKKQQLRRPYPPFITSTLQQEASRKLGFGAKKTMQLAQRLYEGVDIDGDSTALITYMRTDGVQLSKMAVDQARKFIQNEFGTQYLPKSPIAYKSKVRNAQEAHEAIRPVNVSITPESIKNKIDQDQWRLYDLIWRRMVACQMNNVILDQVHVIVSSKDKYAELKSVGTTIAFDGFYRVYRQQSEDKKDLDKDKKMLPLIKEGEDVELLKWLPEQHFTDPPPRYSEASLVKKLEELSIGRPSTYASIISVLQDRKYARLDNKRFIPEERGRIVTAFLVSFFKKYVEYDFTAKLEDELDTISNGKMKWKDFLNEFWKHFNPQAEEIKKYKMEDILQKLTPLLDEHIFANADKKESKKCPSCKKGELKIKMSRFGPFLACSEYPDCKHTSSLERKSDEGVFKDKTLGKDPETKEKILLKKGPYGFYLQLGEEKDGDKSKILKRSALPKSVRPDNIDLEYAVKLMSLPRDVCLHPETGLMIQAGIGKFSPYLLYNGRYARLSNIDEVFEISNNEAIRLVDQNEKLNGRVIGQLDKTDISLHKGRFGPYIKYGNQNIKIPKGTDIDQIDLDKVIVIIKKHKPSKPKKTRKTVSKKSKKAKK